MSDNARNNLNRRQFLHQVEQLSDGVIAVALCGALPVMLSACGAAHAARTRYVPTTRVGDRLTVPRSELSGGSGVLVEIPGTELPLYLRSDAVTGGSEHFSAVSTRCMHRGCQVEPTADRLSCPCHGSEYTFAGAVLQGPTELPLVRYQVSVDAVNIYIHLPTAERS